jgi:serine/threonine-protein kinase
MNIEGKTIRGRWNKNIYNVKNLIGEGGIGKVYKAYAPCLGDYCALKISKDLQSITKESNMLNKFSSLGCVPQVIDIDDYWEKEESYYFIVLEYIDGENLKQYIESNKIDIKESLGLVLIIGNMIKNLHKEKFIFGDLKPQNIMVDRKNKKIKIIDLGGVVPMGGSVKEFTLLYDRSKWNMGLRKADAGYDLFSLSMLLVNLILKNEKQILNMEIYDIINELKRRKINKKLVYIIEGGLLQKINFNYFLKNLKNIYKTIHLDSKVIYNNKADFLVNSFFVGSIICFFTVVFFILDIWRG